MCAGQAEKNSEFPRQRTSGKARCSVEEDRVSRGSTRSLTDATRLGPFEPALFQ